MEKGRVVFMKKRVYRGWFSLIALVLVLAGCSGGASPNDSGAEGGSAGTGGETGTVPISVFVNTDGNIDYKTNQFTKVLEKKANVKLQFTEVPYDGAAEKRQISLASGDYPDLYMLIPWVDKFSQSDLVKFGQQGVILPLNDLIDQYAPNIKKALDDHPDYKAMSIAPDGNIYGLTMLNECFHCSYPNKMWVNTSWLKKLNLEVPKTTEDFKKMLEAFKTKDPNGNGKADEVPLSGSIENFGVHILPFLMNGFIYDDDKYYLTVNGDKVDIAANKPEWKEGLAYARSLYAEGLIDPGAFTQNADAFKLIGNNTATELLGAGASMHPAIFTDTGEGNKYSSHYDAIPPLQGPHAAYATFNYPVEPGATFVLTNKASKEVQISAIKMLDYIYTEEGQLLGNYGEEGKDWVKPKEGDVPLNEKARPIFKTLEQPAGSEPRNSAWGATAQYDHTREFRDGWIQETDIYKNSGYERRLQEATYLYENKQPKEVYPNWSVWIDPAAADEQSMLQQNIKDYVDQNALQFVTGAKNLDKDWDAYVKGLDALNLKRYLEIMQQAYDTTKKAE